MRLNIRLKTAMFEETATQRDIAKETGIHYTRLSKIVNGWVKPTAVEKRRIAKVLRRRVDDLFEPRAAA